MVNYDFPSNLEQYCHRIGRTGRDELGALRAYYSYSVLLSNIISVIVYGLRSGTSFSFFTRLGQKEALWPRQGTWLR